MYWSPPFLFVAVDLNKKAAPLTSGGASSTVNPPLSLSPLYHNRGWSLEKNPGLVKGLSAGARAREQVKEEVREHGQDQAKHHADQYPEQATPARAPAPAAEYDDARL